MIYRVCRSPIALLAFIAWFVLPAYAVGKPVDQPAVAAGSLRFVDQGNLFPRRSHLNLQVESVNIAAFDISLFHVGEANILKILNDPAIPPPAEANQIWHGRVETHAELDKPITTPIDILQLAGQLQPGLYLVDIREGLAGKDRPEIRRWLMISNLGIEAFSGSDGITAQVRLLSEVTAAENVEVALIAGNNRELARSRTDNQGFVRFNADLSNHPGDDAAAALYAYGADGEFTALPLDKAQQVFGSEKHAAQSQEPLAWICLERGQYEPNDTVHGFILLRDELGHGVNNAHVRMQMIRDDGAVAEEQNTEEKGGGAYSFTLHAPPGLGHWTVAAFAGPNDLQTGKSEIIVGPISADATTLPQAKTESGSQKIVISPGRRSFQPGETANISVQPPFDSDVTIVLADQAVRATLRQHIGKEGAVVQIPVPQDVTNGAYVIATAYLPPNEATNTPMQRAIGIQALEIDKGDKQLGVRLETPESVSAAAGFPVGITLPDLNGSRGYSAVIGISGNEKGSQPDPLTAFLGPRPFAIQVFDTSNGLIGAAPSAMAVAESAIIPHTPLTAPSLVWTGPLMAGQDGRLSTTINMPPLVDTNRLKLTVIGWSADRVGLAATDVIEQPGNAKKVAKEAAKPTHPIVSTHEALTLVPGATLKKKAGTIMVVSSAPILAVPLKMTGDGSPIFFDPQDKTFIALGQSMLDPMNDDTMLVKTLQLVELAERGLPVASHTVNQALDRIEEMNLRPDLPVEQKSLAQYILLRTGRESEFGFRLWLAQNPDIASVRAHAAVAASLARIGEKDRAGEESAKTLAIAGKKPLDLVALLLLTEAGVVPNTILQASASALPPDANPIKRALIEKNLTRQGGPFTFRFEGADVSAKGITRLEGKPGTAVELTNRSNALLFLWILTQASTR